MTFILVDDEKRCNFCVYWTGMRKSGEEFVYVDLDSAEWGICLHPEERHNGRPTQWCRQAWGIGCLFNFLYMPL